MKNNNLTLIGLLSILSILVIATTITSVHSQRPDPILTENSDPMLAAGILDYEDKILDKKNAKVNATENVPKFFAIQHAESGSISEINETAYTLELNDVSDKTILFSDRPDKIVMSVSTADYIGNWSSGVDSFAVDAPNAVLVVDEQEGIQDIALIELFNPVYDIEKKTLRYDVTLDNSTAIEMTSELGQNTLVIDQCDACLGGP